MTLTAGDYRFSISSDDGSRAYIDNDLVLDRWNGNNTTDATITLGAGSHTIRVEYYEDFGGAGITFSYAKALFGAGTAEDPYQISTCADLQEMSHDADAHYILMNNVDCAETATWHLTHTDNLYLTWPNGRTVFPFPTMVLEDNFDVRVAGSPADPQDYTVDFEARTITFGSTPNAWVGISFDYYAGFNPIANFTGDFDGDGYTISNLYIFRHDQEVGLFKQIKEGGSAHDVSLTNISLTGVNNAIGGIAGENYYGHISNATVSGTIENFNGSRVGGVVGGNRHESTVTNVVSAVSIASHYNAYGIGGAVGANGGMVTKSHATGALSCTDGNSVGGFIGRNGGSVSYSYATGDVSCIDEVGGFLGYNDEGIIVSVYATGDVTGTGDGTGGLVGKNSNGYIVHSYATGDVGGQTKTGGLAGANGGFVIDSYATGDVTGTGDGTGGLLGRSGGRVQRAYAVGSVTGTADVGGLIGYFDEGQKDYAGVENSFWDTDTTGQSDSDGGGTGKTTLEMQESTLFTSADWNTDIWGFGSGYPTFQGLGIFDGNGTEIDPYLVTNCLQLQYVNYIATGYFKLDSDINCTETATWNKEEASVYFGDADGVKTSFNSPFLIHASEADGLNVEVNSVTQDPSSYTMDYETGTLTFAEAPPSVGIRIYFQFYGGFDPAHSNGDFRAVLDGDGHKVTHLHINSKNYDDNTGMIGTSYGTVKHIYLENVEVIGNYRVGALVGENLGTILDSGSSGYVYGADIVGGLVGGNRGHQDNFPGDITRSFSIATVQGGDKIGGLVGANGGTIEDTYARGEVTGTGVVGGLVGRCGGSIYSSYATGHVTGNSIGGLLSDSDGCSVSGSFWDTETTETEDGDGGVSLATEDMKDSNTFDNAEWNLSTVWNLDPELNAGYPYLRGQVFFGTDTTGPAITDADVVPSETSAVITWTTDEASSSKVLYALTVGGTFSETSETDTSSRVTSHSVTLSGLTACTLYAYRLYSNDADGNSTTNDTALFTTTGCSASTTPIDTTASSIDVEGTTTVTLEHGDSSLSVATQPNFTSETSVVIQIKTLDQSTVIGLIGVPRSMAISAPVVFDVKALIDAETLLDSFDIPVTLTYVYAPSDVEGINESTLRLYHYHEGSWSPLDGCSVDTGTRTVSCTTSSFSIFGLFGSSIHAGSTSSSGGVMYGCTDPKATNYQSLSRSKPSLCTYAPVSASSPSFVFTKDLRFGMTDPEVQVLQKFLNSHGYIIAQTGPGSVGNETNLFGNATKSALIKFQIAQGITPAVGMLGPMTRLAIAKSNTTSTPASSALTSTPNTHTQSAGIFARDLTIGASGDDVLALQNYLISLHIGPASQALEKHGVTPYFGLLTKNALIEYQRSKGISGSGYFGPITMASVK